MKITQIEVIKVKAPYHEGISELMTRRNLYQVNHIYKVHTDAGIVGIGDDGRQPDEEIQKYIGRNPFEFMNGWAPTPLQQAFYDIMGKALGVPVYQLLGEKVQDRVPFGYWSIDMTPEEWAAEAKHAYALGYRLHKIKARPWFDIAEQVGTIADAVPSDYKLRVDANDSFETPARTLEVAKQLQDYNIEAFETPIPQSDIEGYKEIRRGSDMPITIHFGNPDPIEAIRANMNDSFIIAYPDSRAANARREASISDSAHLPVWIQIVGLGITTAYVAHLAATMSNATMSSMTLSALRANDLVKPSLIQLEDGYLPVPDGPGLGVELDEDAVEDCRE
jgi:L-alanine-DL-glutamate epimerase-like enolase superfamily enzyme